MEAETVEVYPVVLVLSYDPELWPECISDAKRISHSKAWSVFLMYNFPLVLPMDVGSPQTTNYRNSQKLVVVLCSLFSAFHCKIFTWGTSTTSLAKDGYMAAYSIHLWKSWNCKKKKSILVAFTEQVVASIEYFFKNFTNNRRLLWNFFGSRNPAFELCFSTCSFVQQDFVDQNKGTIAKSH